MYGPPSRLVTGDSSALDELGADAQCCHGCVWGQGTPDEVAAGLQRIVDWGATHLICSLGAEMFTLWSDSTLELFAHEVLPRVRKMQVTA